MRSLQILGPPTFGGNARFFVLRMAGKWYQWYRYQWKLPWIRLSGLHCQLYWWGSNEIWWDGICLFDRKQTMPANCKVVLITPLFNIINSSSFSDSWMEMTHMNYFNLRNYFPKHCAYMLWETANLAIFRTLGDGRRSQLRWIVERHSEPGPGSNLIKNYQTLKEVTYTITIKTAHIS